MKIRRIKRQIFSSKKPKTNFHMLGCSRFWARDRTGGSALLFQDVTILSAWDMILRIETGASWTQM